MESQKRIRLKVASPCTADWNAMKGDDAVRHCGSCRKSVYQISNMSTEQVEALLAESGEDKCVRFYQRKDGTLLTEDCSVGLRRKRRKQAVVGAGMGVLSALGLAISAGAPPSSSAAELPVPEVVEEVVTVPDVPVPPTDPVVEPVPEYELVMGGLARYEIEDDPVDR